MYSLISLRHILVGFEVVICLATVNATKHDFNVIKMTYNLTTNVSDFHLLHILSYSWYCQSFKFYLFSYVCWFHGRFDFHAHND